MNRPDVSKVLSGLKDFQRATVEHVFRRMYEDDDYVRRFLLADEVGLGKTLVTRGVIAKAIDRLWDNTDRIDVIYICSNGDIARQNVERLRIGGTGEFKLATRITMLPVLVGKMKQRLNFLSFTPGTSFDLKSSMGMADERVLLFRLLHDHWSLSGRRIVEVFSGDAAPDRFKARIKARAAEQQIDSDLQQQFLKSLDAVDSSREQRGLPKLREVVEGVRERLASSRAQLTREEYVQRRDLIAELRSTLAATCLEALEPDVIVLDEFQRFRHLLDEQDESGRLARKLFDYSDERTSARVLLVSATPYKMYTGDDEGGGDDHYKDFLTTVRFLNQNDAATRRVGESLSEYHRALLRVNELGTQPVLHAKESIEQELRRVIVRTERLAATDDRDGMLVEMPCKGMRLDSDEVSDFVALERISDAVESNGTIEYWKSAPYLLSFMEQYDVKRAIARSVDTEPNVDVAWTLRHNEHLTLPWSSVEKYQAIDWRNARLRWLAEETVERGAWRLLWVPPTKGSYAPAGAFADPALTGFTKRLVFSAWHVVPKAIASLLSYEAERRMMLSADAGATNTAEDRKARRGLLRFAKAEGRLTGLPLFLLFYPSPQLAASGDPRTAAESNGSVSASGVVESVARNLEERLEPHIARLTTTGGAADERWYWIGPLLLDMQDDPAASTGWLSDPQLADLWVGEAKDTDDGPIEGSDTGWKEHLAELRLASEKAPTLGPPPGDLFIVLARAAVAGPANASLRALSRLTGGRNAQREAILRTSAARMAWGFRSLFNIPEVMALLRGLNAVEPYWQRVLEYCVDGDLSAVLEEYVHVLRESLGLVDRNRFEAAAAIADHVAQVLSLRTSVLGADDIRGLRSGRLLMEKRRIRTRFAMRFGEQTTDEAESGQAGSGQVAQKTRGDQVRSAFNSPFWPFVLTSTSVGQEGLDFHQYCHAVVHWNLPSNPVDLEQREGRVHRYKGHAVRKNVARTAGSVGVAADATREAADPWEVMFGIVHRSRRSDESELVPFWVYPVEGGAKIERYVPALPLSREITQYAALRRALTVYRMAFGQPRQEDLVAYLLRTIPTEAVTTLLSRIQIDLAPPSRREPTDPRGIATAESADVWSAASARIRHGGAKSSVIERPRTVEALAAARRNPETGRRVLEMLFPDVSLRRAMELQLVASIRAAHDVNAQSWAVTLLANDNIYVRLNVGGIEVLRLDRRETDRLMLVVRVSALDRLLKEELRSRDMLQSGAPFSTEPHARLVYLRDAEIAAWAPRVTAAHLSMVRLAASHVRTQTAALKQHSPGIVEYLRGVGLEVPGASAT